MQLTQDFENLNYVKKGIAQFMTKSSSSLTSINTDLPVFESINFNDSQNIIKLSNTKIRLKANVKYRLSGWIPGYGSNSATYARFRWHDGVSYLGDIGIAIVGTYASGGHWIGKPTANLIITPTVDTDITLRVYEINGSIAMISGHSGAIIEELETYTAPTYNLQMLGIGNGQTWQNVTTSRAFGTTYVNTTGKPIFLSLRWIQANASSVSLKVDNIEVDYGSQQNIGGGGALQAIIPNGSSYYITNSGQQGFVWAELR